MKKPDSFGCKICDLFTLSPLKPVFASRDEKATFHVYYNGNEVKVLNFVQAMNRLKKKNSHYVMVAFRRIQRFPKIINSEPLKKLLEHIFCAKGIDDPSLINIEKIQIKQGSDIDIQIQCPYLSKN